MESVFPVSTNNASLFKDEWKAKVSTKTNREDKRNPFKNKMLGESRVPKDGVVIPLSKKGDIARRLRKAASFFFLFLSFLFFFFSYHGNIPNKWNKKAANSIKKMEKKIDPETSQ